VDAPATMTLLGAQEACVTFGSAHRGFHLLCLPPRGRDGRNSTGEVHLMMAIFGAILPRFVILAGWVNNQAAWESIFGAPIWLLVGFLVFPWTTLIYGLVEANGMSILNWIFVVCALLIDLATYGLGAFATRKQVSNFRGM
jgi:hypothetical protein